MMHSHSYLTSLLLAPSIFSLVRVNSWAINNPLTAPYSLAIQHYNNPPAAAQAPHSDLLDLTSALGPKVAAFHKYNPDSPIQLLAKAEFRNPASKSHKDRIARAIIHKAVARGELTNCKDGNKKTSKSRHYTLVEPRESNLSN